MAVIVGNPERGCGTKVEGGCYLDGDMFRSPNGRLRDMMVFNAGFEGGQNIYPGIKPRGQVVFNPAATFAAGEFVTDLTESPEGDWTERVGMMGLADHVGRDNYTPWAFIEECFKYGPSRRVDPDLAWQVAPYLPLPVLFVMDMPLLESRDQALGFAALAEAAGRMGVPPKDTDPRVIAGYEEQIIAGRDDDDLPPSYVGLLNFGAVWADPRMRWFYPKGAVDGFGYVADDQWIAYLVRRGGWDTLEEWARKARLPFAQQPVFVSFLTRALWIVPQDATEDDMPEDLKAAGVVAGILETDPRVQAEEAL